MWTWIILAGLLSLSTGLQFQADDRILVNKLLDYSLSDFAKKMTENGDITGQLETGSIGGYTVSGGKLADMTTLERVGNAWMWNERRTVIVNGTLRFGTLFLAHAQISGPQNVPDPLITVSKNRLNFELNVTLTHKSHCTARYMFRFTTLDGVTLYSGNPHLETVDLSGWVKRNMDSVNQLLVDPLHQLFMEHINMCESKWLNMIEMIKYREMVEYELMNNS